MSPSTWVQRQLFFQDSSSSPTQPVELLSLLASLPKELVRLMEVCGAESLVTSEELEAMSTGDDEEVSVFDSAFLRMETAAQAKKEGKKFVRTL